MFNILRLVTGFGIRSVRWLQHSREAIGEKEDVRFRIEYCVFFISNFFICNFRMYCIKF
jgi:hypothetical protein